MSFRRFFALFLVCFLAFSAAGCRMINPGGDDDTAAALTPAARLSVVVSRPAAGADASIRASLKAQTAVRVPFADADSVKIYFADGATPAEFLLTQDPDKKGTYLLDLNDALRERLKAGYVIKAIKGAVELVNIITPDETPGETIDVDEVSTAYSYYATQQMAKEKGTEATPADVIKNFYNSATNFAELKKKFADGLDEVKSIVEFFAKIVSEADAASTTGGTILDNIDELKNGDQTIDQIIEGTTIIIPVKSDEDFARAISQRFVGAMFDLQRSVKISQDQANLLGNLLDDGFMHNGNSRNEVVWRLEAGQPGEYQESGIVGSRLRPAIIAKPLPASLNITSMQLEKLDESTYVAGPNGTVTFSNGDVETISFAKGFSISKEMTSYDCNSFSPESIFPFLVIKKDGKWFIKGNGIKVQEVLCNLQLNHNPWATAENEGMVNQKDSNFVFEVKPSMDESSDIRITKVTVTGKHVTGEEELLNKLGSEGNFHYFPTYKYRVGSAREGYPAQGLVGVTHAAGDEYKIKVTYNDGGAQEFTFRVPDLTGVSYLEDVTATKSGSNLVVTWPESTLNDFESYEVEMFGNDKQEFFTRTSKSASFLFPVNAEDSQLFVARLSLLTKRGVSSHCGALYKVGIADSTKEKAVAILKALDSATRDLNLSMKGVTPPVTSTQFSTNPMALLAPQDPAVALVNLGFPAGTEFFPAYTAYVGAGSLTNMFKLPTTGLDGLTHLLFKLYDNQPNAIVFNNPALSAVPFTMDMMAVYEKAMTAGNISMLLEVKNQFISNFSADSYLLPFEGTGVIQTTFAGKAMEIRLNKVTAFTAKEQDGSPFANGSIDKADLLVDYAPFMINQKTAILKNCAIDETGLVAGDVYVVESNADLTKVASIHSNDGANLELQLLDDQGNITETIAIE